jgi:MFS family permease
VTISLRRWALPPVLRSLRHRNYQLFFSGQLVSLIGTWMQSVAQSWLVYRLTGSSFWLGMIGFSSQLPVLLLAPLGGAVADRIRRHRIIVTTQAASMVLAFVLAGLTLSGLVRPAHVFALGALLGLVNAFDIPARQSFLVEMVGREDLGNAIALNSSMFNGARLVGPAVAGILVGWIGEGYCFLGNAVSFVAVLAGLLAMRFPPWNPPHHSISAIQGIAQGFQFVGRTPPIRAVLLLLGLVSLLGMPYVVLMPIFADSILHGGPKALGMLMGASGAGAMIGALRVAARRELRGLGRWVSTGAIVFGVSLVLFSQSRWLPLSIALLVPAGFSLMVQMSGTNTLVQSMVPDALRGRVMAVYSMMFMGMAPFGALYAGTVATRIGAPATVLCAGLVCIMGGTAFALYWPRLRQGAREILAARRSEAEESDQKRG